MRNNIALRRRGAVLALIASGVLITALLPWTGDRSASGAAAEHESTAFAVVGDGSVSDEQPPLRAGRDPLSAAETGYAIHLATTHSSVPVSATNVRGEPGPEVLFAELPGTVDNLGRQVVVNLYDYRSETALQQIVDLTTRAVTSLQSSDLQLPLSSDEGETAVRIAIDQGPAELMMKKQFERLHGSPLIDPKQISHVTGVFVYDGTTTFGKECGRHRCAQLLIRVASGDYLDTTDFVVDLSTRSIVTSKEG